MREKGKEKKISLGIQTVYLSVSIFSILCVYTNCYIIICSNIVGAMCFIDLFLVKKRDMVIHHLFVLIMTHYMNTHSEIENREKIVSIILSTEMSTVFLIINNLLNRNNINNIENYDKYNKILVTTVNRLFFVTTFMYYRVYSYYVSLIANKEIHNTLFIYSKSKFQLFEIYLGIYGLFILNLYWTIFIFIKLKKSIKSSDETKDM
jgi:hypothetical protein